jgi:hypothetical protein
VDQWFSVGHCLIVYPKTISFSRPPLRRHPIPWRFRGIVQGWLRGFDDLLRENVGIGEIVGFLEAFGADPKVI